MKGKLVALAASIMTASAFAAPVLDFTGVCNGGQVRDFYNGGTDSCGNSGTNYGIHFDGGTVQYSSTNDAYVSGASRVSFATHSDLQRITFQASMDNMPLSTGRSSYATSNGLVIDEQYIDNAGFSLYQLPPRTLFSPWASSVLDGLVLNTNKMDNLTFYSDSWAAQNDPAPSPSELPEPGALLTLATGAVIMARMRRA